MKNLITLLITICIASTGFAQQGINYKAIIKDNAGNVIANDLIVVQFSILQGVVETNVYTESHTPTTDANGLIILNIGEGSQVSGDYTTIDWASDTHALNTQINTGGGLVDMGTTGFQMVPYALQADKAANVFSGDYNDLTNQPASNTYSIGDFVHGGVVFWVDETGQHGLVCAKGDTSSVRRWYAGTFGNTQAKGDGIYAGKANTTLIIAAHVAIGDDNGENVARISNELQVTEGGITYGDWYLPSRIELNEMYLNKATINSTAVANGGAIFVSTSGSEYWSSNESTNNMAWSQRFSDGVQAEFFKNFLLRSRAIRAF